MSKFLSTILFLVEFSHYIVAQNNNASLSNRRNVITTAVPFLTVNTNAQSRGSGEIGVVASDLYTQNGLQQNPAMLARNDKIIGIQGIDYIPWLRQLVPNVNLFSTGAHTNVNKKSSIGLYAKYFSLGQIQFTDDFGNDMGTANPFEYSIETKFAHLLTKELSVGIGLKYIESDLTSGVRNSKGINFHPGRAVAADLGFDYRKILFENKSSSVNWNFGLSILNIGNKVTYSVSSEKDFLPQTLKIGNLLTIKNRLSNDSYIAFDLAYQLDKLLVPSPPVFAVDEFGNVKRDQNGNEVIEHGRNPNINCIQAILQSFYDAPGGIREELHELIHQFGTEIRLNTLNNKLLLAGRGGYFLEHQTKGGRNYVTMGAGLGIFGFRLDASYLIPLTQRHPLQNTLALSLGARFNIDRKGFFKFI